MKNMMLIYLSAMTLLIGVMEWMMYTEAHNDGHWIICAILSLALLASIGFAWYYVLFNE